MASYDLNKWNFTMAATLSNKISQYKIYNPLLEYIFIEELKDIYWTEKLYFRLLPKIQAITKSPTLKLLIKKHTVELAKHIRNLEHIFKVLGHKPKFHYFEELSLFSEGNTLVINALSDDEDKDISILLLSTKVSSFEKVTYKGLIELANILEHTQFAETFKKQENVIIQYEQSRMKLSNKIDNKISLLMKIKIAVKSFLCNLN